MIHAVQGTVRTAAMQSTLLEYPGDITESDAHVRALAERVAHYARELQADITHAADVEDADTANVYTDLSRGIDQRLSFLEAHSTPEGTDRPIALRGGGIGRDGV